MENPRSPLLSWPYFYQPKSTQELRHTLLCTTIELESTRVAAHEEITKRAEEITHLQELLNRAIKERDEAQEKCRKLLLDKLKIPLNNPRQLHSSTTSSIEDEQNIVKKDALSSSDCEESIVSSPPLSPQIKAEKPLPEKGKLLQAVMNAGPLLQTLLLAGPLPQWRHPPPPLETFEIPLVQIPGSSATDEFMIINASANCGHVSDRKRSYSSVADAVASFEINKYQRVLFP